MVQSPSHLNVEGLTLVFGPQDPSIDDVYTRKLRATLLRPGLEWILEALTQLPQQWQTISDSHPELAAFQGEKYLQLLNDWVRRGTLPQNLFPLPNIIVTPLVVATHLAQYTEFLNLLQPGLAQHDSLPAALTHEAEAVGLCTGLLSTAAVASSASISELQKNGAVAIRMAMAIGAVVDSGDTAEDGEKWQSLAVGWTSQNAENEMGKIVKQFPEAYVSVISEARLATITVLKSDAPELLNQLKKAGLIFSETALRGPFHCRQREDQAASLLALFDSVPSFQFPDTARLIFPTRTADGKEYHAKDKLHHTATRAMLTDQADWHTLFTALQESTSTKPSLVVSFGRQRFVPQWYLRKLGSRLVHFEDLDLASSCPAPLYGVMHPGEDEAIAVVGMACHLPGGNDIDEFWDMLCTGQSQHKEVPTDRLDFDTAVWRDKDLQRKWYGNFVQDHDAFDHKFFKKSPREMVSTDPQHRLMLQVAHQAVQQSGYFNASGASRHVGCYVGIGVADYENNVACHPPTAYTATGNLKSFAAGKISHYFGWSGPGVTIDTACSSSALAVHHACKAILHGECDSALAGGTSIMTSPEWYQNLDGASFLSSTGQCKPFDADADGYCRGEGAGAVFLKKLSVALEDGDQILGIINASSVNQNENCSAITAPSVKSLSDVFGNVVRKARLDPKQISVVEAHGTGTQVGDRAEYDSVRNVLGGPGRAESLVLGSVKGHIGHLECASGIAALIKVLLMLYNGAIPPQASFRKLSPRLNATPSDNVEIATSLRPWEAAFRAALLNNYGASGSNASLVVTQNVTHPREALAAASRRPFWLGGVDHQSLRTYAAKMVQFLRSRKDARFTIDNLAFQLSRQSNRSLGQALIFSCASVDELEAKLSSFADGRGDAPTSTQESPRPVILCFGGQTSNFIGLDREAYDHFKLLRTHIDHCHEVCLSLGLDGILPAIFERTPRASIVELQTMQFALQYSSAKSWIDSGVQVAALVGHSFGELTAMCVSGTLPVKDALKMIAGRASLIQDRWGTERGSMMAVDGDLETVQKMLLESNSANPNEAVNIACFNGPRSFTLAGTSTAMALVRETIAADFSSIKTKPLDVTHAFHSALVDPILPRLKKIGEGMIFHEPVIQHERATQKPTSGPPSLDMFASHMREPVYFSNAVQRLAQKYPSSVWLEAGSNSGVTTMASRAVGPNNMVFHAMNITNPGAVQNVADVTTQLWKEGVNTSFWAHHSSQTSEYPVLLLPPYQFEKTRHWLDRKKLEVKAAPAPVVQESRSLWTFLGYKNEAHAQFRINTASDDFKTYVEAHVIAQTAPICPSMFQHIIARDALSSLVDADLLPQLEGMESDAPLCLDESRVVTLDAKRGDESWDFRITSTDKSGANSTQHVSGRLYFRQPKDSVADFAKFERLVDSRRAQELLNGNEADQVIQGSRNIYKAFEPVVQYNDDGYRGLQKLTAKGNESAGRISKRDGKSILGVGLGDTFCQVAGIFLNCMTDCEDGEMYLSNRVDEWIRSPTVPLDSKPEQWEVYARHHQPSPKEYVSDIFVFAEGKLVWVVLGLHFVKVSISGMQRLLSRLSGRQAKPSVQERPILAPEPVLMPITAPVPAPETKRSSPVKKAPKTDNVLAGLRRVFCNLLGLEPEDVQLDSDLVELGIDSLLAMEVAKEVENEFGIKFELEELMEMTDVRSLANCVRGTAQVDSGYEEGSDIDMVSTDGSTKTPPEDEPRAGDLPGSAIIEAFTETKTLTDHFIEQNSLSGYSNHVQPRLTELVIAYVLDAFDQMGCPLRSASAGQKLERVSYLPKHEKVMQVFYRLLVEARLVDISGSTMTRTAVPVPGKSAETMLQDLLREYPEHAYDHKLTALTGTRLYECLTGKAEGIQLLFGTAEGRELAAGMYGKSPINVAWLAQLQHFWERLLDHLPQQQEPICILEMGAGTGGTTAGLLPLLARSGIPIRYTATDISPSLVAGLRKRFKEYPWIRFEVVDVEKAPPANLLQSQHVVLATNCVHATHSLTATTKNIHKILRPDGFLIMLEMTEEVPWVDSVFGLVDGWWLFDDGRQHALAQPEVWEKTLRANGYGHVDWTDGRLPENTIQRIIVAMASGQNQRVPLPPHTPSNPTADFAARQVVVDSFVQKHTQDFAVPASRVPVLPDRRCVLVTGATGSLGSHLVAHLAAQPSVRKVICLNRVSSSDATIRQHEALRSRGLVVDLSKLEAIETDSSKPMLGLSASQYGDLTTSVTDVVHNAWAMSMTRPARGFEPQFKAMRNLIDLCRDCASQGTVVGFQFVSSVSVVGCHPFVSGNALAPEERVTAESALPMGYADAKLICERMLDETLHRHDAFRITSVRVGQICGSTVNGYWNPVEHLVHLFKSSQTLGVLPDLDGVLSWCPVNHVAGTLGDLLLGSWPAYPVYHIENMRQSWPEMISVLSGVLGIPRASIVSYGEWLRRVRQFPPSLASENPAVRLADFFETDFLRMSCGGLILDTAHTREHSVTLRNSGAIDNDLVTRYVQAWKDSGFLR